MEPKHRDTQVQRGNTRERHAMDIIPSKPRAHKYNHIQKPTARGFEPLRAEPNGFLVHHLNHSVTLSAMIWDERHIGEQLLRAHRCVHISSADHLCTLCVIMFVSVET